MDRLSLMMNDWNPQSEIRKLCEKSGQGPVKVSQELFEVLTHAKKMHAQTQGVFDITAKPLIDLWRQSMQTKTLPTQAALAQAKARCGIEKMVLDAEKQTVTLTQSDMLLDVGGIAKGYIGDRVVALLGEQGFPICRFHAGGEMVFGDPPPGKTGWAVNIPDHGDLSFEMANGAASISGDVFRFVEIDGVRYSHVCDPRTGAAITNRQMAVLRGKRGIDTDPLATAGCILPPEQWKALIEGLGMEGEVFVAKASEAGGH